MAQGTLRRAAILVLAAVATLPLAGCSVEGPGQWRYRGDLLLQVDKDLAAMTGTWREHVRAERGALALPDGAACYLRISAPHDVDDEVVCGPLLGPQPRWESAAIAGYYSRDGKVALGLTAAPEKAFSPVEDSRLGALRAADGSAPDLDAAPVAPSLPALAPGQVRSLQVDDDEVETDVFEDPDPDEDDGYRLIDATDHLLRVRLHEVDPAADAALGIDVVAPPGCRLLVVEVMDLNGVNLTSPDEGSGVPVSLSIRGGADLTPQEVELPAGVPGAASAGADGSTSLFGDGTVPPPARWVVAVPDGDEASVEITDGVHAARAGSAPGDLTNDFPSVVSYDGDPTILPAPGDAPGEGLRGDVAVQSWVEIQRNQRPEDGPSPVRAEISTFDPTESGSGPLRWYRDGRPIAGYTATALTVLDPSVELDGVTYPATVDPEVDGVDGFPVVRTQIPLAPESEAPLTLRGTLRIEVSAPIAVTGPGYDGTLPDGVPATGVVELPFTQQVETQAIRGEGTFAHTW